MSKHIATILNEHKETLKRLESKKIYLMLNVANGRALQDVVETGNSPAINLDAEKEKMVVALLESKFLTNYPQPVLFDFLKAVLFMEEKGELTDNAIEQAYLLSRVNFMGTDGIRGKISEATPDNYLGSIIKDNELTCGLIENCSFSFVNMLQDRGVLKKGDTVCVGNDGRDVTTGWKFNTAVSDGFKRAALNVVDLGVVPTPYVPYKMLKEGYGAGAALTASHNPSNQNGIKYFNQGRKMLPEGAIGDYTFSAYIYHNYRNEMPPVVESETNVLEGYEAECIDYLFSILPNDIKTLLRDSAFVFDNSNGAYAAMGLKVLDQMGLDYECNNPAPDGYNINKECGVSELENIEAFEGANKAHYPEFIQSIFDKGRSNKDKKVFGMALDGDGDRGYTLFYEKADDSIRVLDGDKTGFLIAKYLLKNGGDKDTFFVSTIESDLMTSIAAKNDLGLKTAIVSVGDKWIGNFDGKICVGVESSGHLIYPVEVTANSGKKEMLFAGNGLLTCLTVLAAIHSLGLEGAEIYKPFEAGLSKTLYRFFVDKSKFYCGSAVWNEDIEIIKENVAKLVAEGQLPKGSSVEMQEKEDKDILYAAIKDGDNLLGCIIARNSGTEDKTAVYILGDTKKTDPLMALGNAVNANHLEKMKNQNRVEFEYEAAIIEELKSTGATDEAKLESAVAERIGKEVDKRDFGGVLHGLKKEDRIAMDGETISLPK